MSAFESILSAERSKVYRQRNIDLYTYYTMSLIAQAEAERRMRARLKILSSMMLISVALMMIPFKPVTVSMAAYLTPLDWQVFVILALVGYALTLCMAIGLRGVRLAFR